MAQEKHPVQLENLLDTENLQAWNFAMDNLCGALNAAEAQIRGAKYDEFRLHLKKIGISYSGGKYNYTSHLNTESYKQYTPFVYDDISAIDAALDTEEKKKRNAQLQELYRSRFCFDGNIPNGVNLPDLAKAVDSIKIQAATILPVAAREALHYEYEKRNGPDSPAKDTQTLINAYEQSKDDLKRLGAQQKAAKEKLTTVTEKRTRYRSASETVVTHTQKLQHKLEDSQKSLAEAETKRTNAKQQIEALELQEAAFRAKIAVRPLLNDYAQTLGDQAKAVQLYEQTIATESSNVSKHRTQLQVLKDEKTNREKKAVLRDQLKDVDSQLSQKGKESEQLSNEIKDLDEIIVSNEALVVKEGNKLSTLEKQSNSLQNEIQQLKTTTQANKIQPTELKPRILDKVSFIDKRFSLNPDLLWSFFRREGDKKLAAAINACLEALNDENANLTEINQKLVTAFNEFKDENQKRWFFKVDDNKVQSIKDKINDVSLLITAAANKNADIDKENTAQLETLKLKTGDLIAVKAEIDSTQQLLGQSGKSVTESNTALLGKTDQLSTAAADKSALELRQADLHQQLAELSPDQYSALDDAALDAAISQEENALRIATENKEKATSEQQKLQAATAEEIQKKKASITCAQRSTRVLEDTDLPDLGDYSSKALLTAQKQLENKALELQQEINQFQQKKTVAQAALSKLEHEHAELERNKNAAQTAAEKFAEDQKVKSQGISELTTKVQEKQAKIQSLEEEISSLDFQIAAQEKAIQKAKDSLIAHKAQVELKKQSAGIEVTIIDSEALKQVNIGEQAEYMSESEPTTVELDKITPITDSAGVKIKRSADWQKSLLASEEDYDDSKRTEPRVDPFTPPSPVTDHKPKGAHWLYSLFSPKATSSCADEVNKLSNVTGLSHLANRFGQIT